jgi:hypothetical protein
MKMSFLPGKLELISVGEEFVLSVGENEVLRTRSQREAVNRFKALRNRLEKEFPPLINFAAESNVALARLLNDIAVDETLKRPPKKRSTARSSRTFG